MQFTPVRGTAAALLLSALALPALAQTTGSGTGATTTQPAQSTGAGQSDQAQTGAAQGGAAQSGTAQGGTAQTGAAQTGTAQPAQGAAAQPGTTQQPAAQDGTSQPAQSATGQTGSSQPAQGASTQAAEQPAGTPAQPAEGEQPAPGSDYAMGDIVLGDPDAPLTVIEYASFTCPHCGTFAVQTFPQLKEQYIDTGKVNFILREVYFDQYGLWASMVARCGGEKGFYPLAETFLTTQGTWTRAPDIGHAIQQVGRRAGLSGERLEQCLSDREYAKQLLADYQANIEVDEVKSTPTFVIGGEMHTGAMSFEEFSELLDAAL